MRRISKLFSTVAAFAFAVLAAPVVFAQEAAAAHAGGSDSRGMVALGAAIAIAVSALGGGLGQGRAAAAALDGIARNPQASGKIFVPMIVALALIESLVIYGLIIALQLVNKV
jgi:F-type H+-transporting ATPase subunit c